MIVRSISAVKHNTTTRCDEMQQKNTITTKQVLDKQQINKATMEEVLLILMSCGVKSGGIIIHGREDVSEQQSSFKRRRRQFQEKKKIGCCCESDETIGRNK
eukprot:14550758-Ditylum_brightwellii.AAC.1